MLDNGTPRSAAATNHPPLFFPPHLASHLSSQFAPPLFPNLKGKKTFLCLHSSGNIRIFLFIAAFPGLCSCCPIKPTNTSPTCSMAGSAISAVTSALTPTNTTDPRSSSVAELRRKAQEHSAALLHSLHAAAAAGLAFPGLHLPPFSMSGRGKSELFSDMSSWVHHSQQQHQLHHSNLNNNNNNNSILQANLEKHKEEAAAAAAGQPLSPKIDPGEDKMEPKNYTIDNSNSN